MKFTAIEKRTITLELSPEEAWYLSLACSAAADTAYGSIPDRFTATVPESEDASFYFEAINAALEAAAIAAAVESHARGDDAKNVTLQELRDGRLLRPLGTDNSDFIARKRELRSIS